MRSTIVAFTIAFSSIASAPAYAWGASAHRYIMRRAIEMLPPQVKPFFDAQRDELILRANDPDYWRVVGWPDDPNHFVDFGVKEYGEYPFTALPRDYDKALEKFGLETLRKNGLLPWREQEMFGNLRRAFEAFARGGFAATDAIIFSAAAAHYIQDAHQPLHATDNYDGQMTGQNGVHGRFEAELFDRYGTTLTISPPPLKPIANVRDFAFDTLLESYSLVPQVLAADKTAVQGKDEYDDDYFDKFLAGVKPLLERRLADSIAATASLIVGAWEQAGRPELKTTPRPPRKVRKNAARNNPPEVPAARARPA